MAIQLASWIYFQDKSMKIFVGFDLHMKQSMLLLLEMLLGIEYSIEPTSFYGISRNMESEKGECRCCCYI